MTKNYLDRFSHSIPDADLRESEFPPFLESGIANHDFRAVDIVERALLDPKWDYRTAQGIETGGVNDRNVLPLELIVSILRNYKTVARMSSLRKEGRAIYAHVSKPIKLSEDIEAARRMRARDFTDLD